MVKKTVSGLIIVFWAVMMSIHSWNEVSLFNKETSPGYRAVFTAAKYKSESVMGIYFKDSKIGTTTTLYNTGTDYNNISNFTRIDFGKLHLPGQFSHLKSELITDSMIFLDTDYHLQRFNVAIRSDSATIGEMYGTVKMGKLILDSKFSGETVRRVVDISENEMLSTGISPFLSMTNLKVGRKWAIKSFNPFTMKIDNVIIEVTGRERFNWRGRMIDVFKLMVRQNIFSSLCWITPDGSIVKQQLPFGITMIAEPKEDKESKVKITSFHILTAPR